MSHLKVSGPGATTVLSHSFNHVPGLFLKQKILSLTSFDSIIIPPGQMFEAPESTLLTEIAFANLHKWYKNRWLDTLTKDSWL